MATRMGWSPGPTVWKDDLSPLGGADWNYDRAAHLLAHAGFGGTPAEIQRLAEAGLERAVRSLVHYENIANPRMLPFVESGFWDPTLNGFPEMFSRPSRAWYIETPRESASMKRWSRFTRNALRS